jgi:electron transfer flavoprotein beta subunit
MVHLQVMHTGVYHEMIGGFHPATAQRTHQRPQERPRRQRCEGHHHQRLVQRRSRRQVEGPVAEKRIRVGVQHDAEHRMFHVTGTFGVGLAYRDREMRPPSVVAAQPRPQRRGHEQRMSRPPLHLSMALHCCHHRGIETHPGMKTEEPVVDPPQADGADVVRLETRSQQSDGSDRVVRQADGAGEHVGRPAGQYPKCRLRSRQTGGDLVHGTVPAEGDHGVEASAGGILGETDGVSPPVGFHNVDLMMLCERSVDHDPVAGGDRRCEGVDHQQQAHDVRRYQGSVGQERRQSCTMRIMNVIVCVKQIPDPATPGALDPSTNTLKRDGKLILDESDSYGVEMALQLVDAAGGGEVSLVSMAPNGETAGMRTALAMGAAKGVLVSDPALQGSDALTTAKVLAAAVQRLGGADLIIAGTESSDGYTGTVPEQIAEVLGLPSVTFAKKVTVDGGALKVERQTEAGYDEVTCSLPALVSVTAGVVEPRYPSFKGIMAAKSKPVDTVTAGDLGISPVGWAGAGQQVSKVAQAEARQAGEIIEDDGEAYAKIVAFLEQLKAI